MKTTQRSQISNIDKDEDTEIEVVTGMEEKIEKLKEVETTISLERILEEQETHDLYCPNCHSCITRRVVLRKRKRTTKEDNSNAKLAKNGAPQLDLNSSSSGTENKDEGSDTAPEVFRCLSCFSYFISTDRGFKLFKIFGKKEESTNTHGPDETPERRQNMLLSFYDSLMGRKKQGEIGLDSSTGEEGSKATLLNLSREKENRLPAEVTVASSSGISKMVQELGKDTTIHNEVFPQDVKASALWEDHKGKMVEISQEDVIMPVPEDVKKDGTAPLSAKSIIIAPSRLPPPSQENEIMPVPEDVAKDANISSSAGPSAIDPSPFVQGLKLPASNETWILVGEQSTDKCLRQAPKWNLLKAIVYGSLLESIAGFSVVSATAGAGTQTACVFAIAFGVLAGGLPIMLHNLIELRNGASEERYEQKLGDRSRFWLHAGVALLFFVLVGAVPPVVYLLSFRGSEDGGRKMAGVAGVSFAMVALLAVAKAHVQEGRGKWSYLGSVVRYWMMAAGASGLSLVVGAGIRRLLDGGRLLRLVSAPEDEPLMLFSSMLQPPVLLPSHQWPAQ
ncbi:membrane protein of ER body-like protein isoform X2 [Wolffia australiana]